MRTIWTMGLLFTKYSTLTGLTDPGGIVRGNGTQHCSIERARSDMLGGGTLLGIYRCIAWQAHRITHSKAGQETRPSRLKSPLVTVD